MSSNASRTELKTFTSSRTGFAGSSSPEIWTSTFSSGNVARASDDLEELDAAGRHARQEQLRRRDGLAGAAVLHRPVGDEVLLATAPVHASERVGRARLHSVPSNLGRAHAATVTDPFAAGALGSPRGSVTRERRDPHAAAEGGARAARRDPVDLGPRVSRAHSAALLEARDAIVEHLRDLGVQLDTLELPDTAPVILGEIPGPEGAPTVLLYGHYDVVPVGEESKWESPPFEATERDGAVYGRGSADSKSNILTHVGALRAWEGKPPVGIKIVIEGQEETGSAFTTYPADAARAVRRRRDRGR